ncbi:MAG: hypothetical protein NXI04_21585 [Planctomycetaceae bacterium]|nr:hypothetical protein [Planctomycetaceae bacterium]
MSESAHDRLSAGLLAAGLTLAATCVWLIALWYSRRVPQEVSRLSPESTAVQREVASALPSTEIRVPDTSDEVAPPNSEQDLQQMINSVTSLQGPHPLPVHLDSGDTDGEGDRSRLAEGAGIGATGRPAGWSAVGTNTAQRWRMEYPAGDLSTYARALSEFDIEPACIFPDGRIIYLTGLADEPQTRIGRVGPEEGRLFMVWDVSSERARGDRELFRKAGVTSFASARLVHFFSPETESRLQTLEYEYRQRTAGDIRRTEFRLQFTGSAAEFVVVRQLLK